MLKNDRNNLSLTQHFQEDILIVLRRFFLTQENILLRGI